MSDAVYGYQPVCKWTNQGSGSAEWCYAKKFNKVWFIKRFLTPVFPDTTINMPEEIRQKKAERFASFRTKKESLHQAVTKAANGNLVTAHEVFQDGNKLFLTSECIPQSDKHLTEVQDLTPNVREVLARSLIDSVCRLHAVGVVHADLRPENLLLKPTINGYYALKIIDFDNGFLIDDPPLDPETFALDPLYAAPEVMRFSSGDKIRLDRQIDVFAMGLLLHLILCGTLPSYDLERFRYPFAALQAGSPITVSPQIKGSWPDLLTRMLSANASDRPEWDIPYQTILQKPVNFPAEHHPVNKDDNSVEQKTTAGGTPWRKAPPDISTPW